MGYHRDMLDLLVKSGANVNVVNKNNTYSYAGVGKVGGNDVSIGHKGEIVASEDTYTLTPEGQASATYSYKIVFGRLPVNSGRPLDNVK